jgi:hypothetical protein
MEYVDHEMSSNYNFDDLILDKKEKFVIDS